MRKPIPTRAGDVLILATVGSFTTYAVGLVMRDGQQDFSEASSVKHLKSRAEAVAAAQSVVRQGRRIFFRNIDTGGWAEI